MSRIEAQVDGRALARAFSRLPVSIRRNVERATTTSARQVATVVRGMLRTGARSGSVLSGGARGRKKRSSAPGEPPARRTGRLAKSIRVVRPKSRGDRISRDVRAQVAYSMALEYRRGGRAPIRPRPFLRPARAQRADETFKTVSDAMAAALREFGQG